MMANSNESSVTLEEGWRNIIKELTPDMPLLMHGSGDVAPEHVDKESAAILAELTAGYIQNLVEAAVNAHDLLTDGAGGILPPPPPSRKRAAQDNWQEPIRFRPKIKGTDNVFHEETQEWKGAIGMPKESRVKITYASEPSTIHTKCFIFPICHDAALYGRVKEVQAARRQIASAIVEPVWAEMLRGEPTEDKEKEGDEAPDNEGVGLGIDISSIAPILPIHSTRRMERGDI